MITSHISTHFKNKIQLYYRHSIILRIFKKLNILIKFATMKKIVLVLMLACTVSLIFSSCTEYKKSTTCPSHDPNFFRR